MYGTGFGTDRFCDPQVMMDMRPETDIPGLFLSGEAVVCPGIAANAFSGLVTAAAILRRSVPLDLLLLHWKNKKERKAKKD